MPSIQIAKRGGSADPTAILIAGAGPSGCAFAITAARRGHRVTLVDEDRRRPPWSGESLPAGGGELLASVFGEGVLDGQQQSFGSTSAWGSAELLGHDFMAHWAGAGWYVDRTVLDARLRQACTAAGVDIVTGAAADALDRMGPDQLDPDWVIDATGRAGSIATRRGARVVRVDDQIALVATVRDTSPERITVVESCATGWWYSLPVPSGDRIVALLTDADLVIGGRRDFWIEQLARTDHMHSYVDVAPQEVSAYPAGTAYREPIVGDGWLAVGDAAIAFDPLSSQGLITGIVMAAHAALAIDGGVQAIADWEADYRVVLDEHLQARSAFWQAEHRWPDATYWSRRQVYA